MFSLTPSQSSVITKIISRTQSGKPLALNPADGDSLAFINLFLDLSNKNGTRYPALHSALRSNTATSTAGAPQSGAIVADLGQDAGGRATSRSWIQTPGLPLHSGACTLVLDSGGNDPLAFGSTTRVGEGLVQVATQTATAKSAAGKMTAVTFYHSQPSPSTPPSFGCLVRSGLFAPMGLTVNVTAPVISVSGHTNVVIGLGRPIGYNPDCDYVFYEDAPQSNPPLLVPFTGNATIPYSITGIGNDGRISGLSINSLIYVALSVGQPSYPLLPESLPLGVYSSAQAPTTLNWTFPYTDPQEPIVYTAASGALDVRSAFLFQFNVPVNDPSSPYVFTICSKDTPEQPSLQCYQIADLQFTWHCVAEGTQVTLADGTTVDIAQTTNKMRVQTGIAQGTAGVEANWRGEHSSRHGRLLRITTANGLSLVLTEHHPVMTPNGLVFAADLKPDSPVLSNKGASAVATVEQLSDYEGTFWNLNLGNAEDRKAGLVGPFTFLANGIVVGDFAALGQQYRASRRNLDYMYARLPESHHKDYESALADSLL